MAQLAVGLAGGQAPLPRAPSEGEGWAWASPCLHPQRSVGQPQCPAQPSPHPHPRRHRQGKSLDRWRRSARQWRQRHRRGAKGCPWSRPRRHHCRCRSRGRSPPSMNNFEKSCERFIHRQRPSLSGGMLTTDEEENMGHLSSPNSSLQFSIESIYTITAIRSVILISLPTPTPIGLHNGCRNHWRC